MRNIKVIYNIYTSVLLGNTPLLKFTRNHNQDSGSLFSIITFTSEAREDTDDFVCPLTVLKLFL